MTIQEGWRWCSRCHGLIYAPAGGRCAAGARHDVAGSGFYSLNMDEATAPGQPNWRWCEQCSALCIGSADCPAGGKHQTSNSSNYTIPHDPSRDPDVKDGQQGWRWCDKCQYLHIGGSPERCPAGQEHDTGRSHYAVHHRADRVFIDAALEGLGAYAGKLFFFRGGHYVRYDIATRRVDAGYPLPLDRWKLSGDFTQGIGAAVNGVRGFQGKAFFFRGPAYTRYDWAGDRIDDGYPLPLTKWNLAGQFAEEVDSALDGRGAFEGKLYLFRRWQYVRYDWASGQLDSGFPAELKAWNLPAPFDLGIDAAVNGHGLFAVKAYFFRSSSYVVYDWAHGTTEAPRAIADGFPGVLELLCVAEGAQQALLWIGAALPWLRKARDLAEAGVGQSSPVEAKRYQALATHFHMDTNDQRKAYLRFVVANYEKVEALLRDLPNKVVFHPDADAWKPAGWDKPPPGYGSYGQPLAFTRYIGDFGPLCQAAMVMHEGFHATIEGGSPDSAYEHERDKYKNLTVEQAVRNPSSYVAFAQNLYYDSDERYGAARPNE